MLDLTLNYIWTRQHCKAIRINLYHIKNKETGAIAADPDIKAILKLNKFRWKTVINDTVTGSRSEVQEVQNTTHQNQLDKSKAQLVREGLKVDDILKEPMTISFNSAICFGSSKNTEKTKLLANFKPQPV